MDPLERVLNPGQLAAVRHGAGPLLILAGAGSGKTRVLTHRIAYLLRERLARAGEILAVTFTNKAAGELKTRVEQLVGPEAERLWVATFHAAGARILRRESEALGLTRAFGIYDEADQLAEVKRACEALGVDLGTAKQHLARIDRWKNDGLLPEAVRVHDDHGRIAHQVYLRYQRALQAANAVDFGDLIARVIELFEKRPDIAERYAERFRHVLVDEFQDTNPAQYQLLRRIVARHKNLCVVGDDDQSIYRWRGAEVENILDFPRHFAGTTVVKLEQNYRSSARILAAAHAVIEKNPRRSDKKLWTARGEGEKVRLVVADTERDEGARVAEELYAENARGTPYSEMAVFYRANAQSRALEDQLRARRIPYRIVRGRSFYDRAEVKDIAAYLRLCINPRSDGDLLRIINNPPRGIGDTTVAALRQSAARAGLSLWETLRRVEEDFELSESVKAKLLRFRALLTKLAEAVRAAPGAAAAVEIAMKDSGYEDRLSLEGEEGEDRRDNLRELVGAAREFDAAWAALRAAVGVTATASTSATRTTTTTTTPTATRSSLLAPGALGSASSADAEVGNRPDPAAALAAAAPDVDDSFADTPLLGFLEQLALVGDADAAQDGDRVSLMTLHAAKGLEFDAVWLTGLEERVFPHARALGQLGPAGSAEEDPKELAEERRLCYVGMTRARRKLTLTLGRTRSLYGDPRRNPPSRFLREIPAELVAGIAALDELDRAPGPWRGAGSGPRGERDDIVYEYEFDQRPRGWNASPGFGRQRGRPMSLRNSARESQAARSFRPAPKAASNSGELGPGARVRHPNFGVGTIEDAEGAGANRKLTVRFPPGVGLKKVLARFVERVI